MPSESLFLTQPCQRGPKVDGEYRQEDSAPPRLLGFGYPEMWVTEKGLYLLIWGSRVWEGRGFSSTQSDKDLRAVARAQLKQNRWSLSGHWAGLSIGKDC